MLLELQCSISCFCSIELFPKGKQRGWSYYECDKCDEMLELENWRYLDVVPQHNGTLRAAASLFIGPGILELDNPLVTRAVAVAVARWPRLNINSRH